MEQMEQPTLTPLRDRILCEVLPVATKTPGGIHIPDGANGRATRAKVLATGRGRIDAKGRRHEPQVKRGDVVIFNAYGIDLVLGEGMVASVCARPGERFVIREGEIIAVVE